MKIFVDTNVIFSAIMSDRGAAYTLLTLSREKKVQIYTSDACVEELMRIQGKISKMRNVNRFLKEYALHIISLQVSQDSSGYVFDPHDEHVLQGAVMCEAAYLVTFNIKDFDRQRIANDFGIRVRTQGMMLQVLRQLDIYE